MYGCSAVNTWSVQSGGPTSPTTVENSGTVVGSRSVLNLSAGQGVQWSISDTGQAISVQSILDTALAQTRAGDQSGVNLLCSSISAGSPGVVYSCALSPTLGAYSAGMVLRWIPDVNGVGGATTLNVDSLGAVPLKQSDGVSNPTSADVVANQLYQLWYDGQVFRELGGAGIVAGKIASGGYYFPFGFPSDGGSSSFDSAGATKLSMFVPAAGMTVSSLAYSVTNATDCGTGTPCGIVFGFYSSSGVLIGQQSAIIAAAGQFQVSFNSPVSLTAGSVYFLASAVDNGSVALQAAGGGSGLFYELANLGTTAAGAANNLATGSGTGLTLPAATGGIAARTGVYASAPVVAFRM